MGITNVMLKTAKKVCEHFDAQLMALPTIKPLDSQAVIDGSRGKKLLVTIEDSVKSIIETLFVISSKNILFSFISP